MKLCTKAILLVAAFLALGSGVRRGVGGPDAGSQQGSPLVVGSASTELMGVMYSVAGENALADVRIGELRLRDIEFGVLSLRGVREVRLRGVRVHVRPDRHERGDQRSEPFGRSTGDTLPRLLSRPLDTLLAGSPAAARLEALEVQWDEEGGAYVARLSAARARIGRGMDLYEVSLKARDGSQLVASQALWNGDAQLRVRGRFRWIDRDGHKRSGKDGRFTVDGAGSILAVIH